MAEGLPTSGRSFEVMCGAFRRITQSQFEQSWANSFEVLRRNRKVKKPWVGRPEPHTAKTQRWIRQMAQHRPLVNLPMMDLGCGDGTLGLNFATALDSCMLVQVDQFDTRTTAENGSTVFMSYTEFKALEDVGPAVLVLSHFLHHLSEPFRHLDDLIDRVRPGSYLCIRDHDVETAQRADHFDFEHYLYNILEGATFPWAEAERHHYFSAKKLDALMLHRGLVRLGASAGSSFQAVYYLPRSGETVVADIGGLFETAILKPVVYAAQVQNTNTAESTIVQSDEAGSTNADLDDTWQKKVVNPPPDNTTSPLAPDGTGSGVPPIGPPPVGPSNPPLLPPSGPILVAPMQPVSPAPVRDIDLRTMVREHPVRFAPHVPNEIAAEFVQMGMVLGKVKTGCAHPCAAGYRAAAARSMLARGLKKGVKEARVLDYFGGERMKEYQHAAAMIPGLKLTIDAAPDDPIDGDAAREFFRVNIANSYDFFVVQDVYQSGASYRSVLSQQALLRLCARTTSGFGYIMIRQFSGEAGQDSEMYDEAMWYRDQTTRDMIHFYPDPTGVGYAMHPDMAWLFTSRSIEGLDVADIAQFGPYKLFSVCPTKPNAQPLAPGDLAPTTHRVELRRIAPMSSTVFGNLSMWWDEHFPSLAIGDTNAQVLVDTRILAAKAPIFAMKMPTPANMSTATSVVHSAMGASPFYQRMLQRFPNIYMKIATGTVRGVVFGCKEEAMLGCNHDNYAFHDVNAGVEVTRAGGWISTEWGVPVIGATALALTMFLKYQMAGASTSSPWAMSIYDSVRSRLASPRAVVVADHVADSAAMIADGWLTRLMKPFEGKIVNFANTLRDFALAQSQDLDADVGRVQRIVQGTPSMRDMAASFTSAVLVSPFFEEALRTYSPKVAALYLCILEPLLKLMHWGPLAAATSACFHSLLTLVTIPSQSGNPHVFKNFLMRTLFHIIWNGAAFAHALTQVSAKRNASSMRYLSSLVLSSGVDANKVISVAVGSYWLAKSAKWEMPEISPEAAASFRATMNGQQYKIEQLGPVLAEHTREVYCEQGHTYPLITPTNLKPASKKIDHHPLIVLEDRYAFVQPSRSPINLLCCIAHRTIAATGATVVKGLWSRIHEEWRDLMYENYYPEKRYTFLEAVANMDPMARARLVNAMRNMDKNGRTRPWKASISVKWNEVISRRTDMGLKPRAIAQMDPNLIADCTAEIHSVSHAMHELWNEHAVYEIRHEKGFYIPVVFIYASGYNAARLNLAFSMMLLSAVTWIWMAGDDNLSVLRVPELNILECSEGDFSKFDSTQGPESLQADQLDMETMGFDSEAVGLDCLGRELPFRVRHRSRDCDLSISFDILPQQASGLPSTTCGNSSRHAKSQYHRLQTLGRLDSTQAAAELGFLLKVRDHGLEYYDATFLKGWWCLFDDGQARWYPLPSMVLKLAKMLRHPSDIFPRRISANGVQEVSFCTRELSRTDPLPLSNPRALASGDAQAGHGYGSRLGTQEDANTRRGGRCPNRSRTFAGEDVPALHHNGGRGRFGGGGVGRTQRYPRALARFLRFGQVDGRLFVRARRRGHIQKFFMDPHTQYRPSPLDVSRLRAGDFVKDANGDMFFRVDPAKKKASTAQLRTKIRRAKADRQLPAPKKSDRTRKQLEVVKKRADKPRDRVRGVVTHDFGLGTRAERVQKRTQVLTRRARKRRAIRRRRGAHVRPSKQEEAWDRELSRQQRSVEQHDSSAVGSTPNGESWWGHVLDSALELAPHIIPLVAGLGDYEEEDLANQVLPKTNSLAAAFSDGEMCSEVPAIHNVGAETRFTHREYIGDVYSTTSLFTKIDFAVNPGMHETFPWASRSIVNYEQYALDGAMFVFQSEASDVTSTLGMGWIALGSQYDVTEAEFQSKKEMFQSQFTVARKPNRNFCHWIECDPSILVLPKKFVRSGAVPASADPHFYDHCRTTLAAGGHPNAGAALGELWITYDLLAMLPRSDESSGQNGLFSQTVTTTGISQVSPYGTGAHASSSRNTFNVSIVGNTVTLPANFPAGDFHLWEIWNGTPAVNAYAAPTVTATTECSFVIAFNPGFIPATPTGGPTQFARGSVFTTTGARTPSWTVSNSSWTGPNAPTSFTLLITQIPRVPPPSIAFFDYGGRELEERYKNHRGDSDSSDESSEGDSVDSARYSLVVADGLWTLTDKKLARKKDIAPKVGHAMRLVSQPLFELMARDQFDAQ